MVNKRKIKFLKNEIDRYKHQISTLRSENAELTTKIHDLNKKDYDKQELVNGMITEFQNLKDEHNKCVKELHNYKEQYIDLLCKLTEIKKRYKKEFKQLIGNIKK